MKLIAFTGFKQSGKTTASRHLQDKYGYQLHNFKTGLIKEIKEKFPDLLEAIVSAENVAFHNDDRTSIEELFIKKPPLIRALMQNYGTEVRRGDNPHYWSDKWLKTYPVASERVVCDDLRFITELEAIKMKGGTIIRIVRTDITSGGDHVSETEQLEIQADYTIEVGKGEHEKLYIALDKIIL
jgi:hypothetical protein